MAVDITAILEPGETIVYRTRGRSYAGTALMYGTLIPAVILFWLLSAMMTGPEPVRWDETGPFHLILGSCMAVVFLLALMIARWAQRHHPDDLAITNRRVLFADSDWDNKLESMALNEIDRVAWVMVLSTRYLAVGGSGRTIKLPPLREGDAAAKALAEAAGLAAPPALGRFAAVDPVQIGMVPAVFAAYLALHHIVFAFALTETGYPVSFEIWWIKLAILLLIVVVAFLIGLSIGGLLTVTVMRPFLSPGRTQALICAGRTERWHVRIALGWASLLYGRSVPYKTC